MKKPKLIARLYRITPLMDKWVKKQAKYYDGESDYIRSLIETERVLDLEKSVTPLPVK